MNSYSVYLHITPSKKVYVGITSQANLNRRWQNGEGYRTQKRFYRAIQKYGWENIEHRIMFSGLTKQEAEEKDVNKHRQETFAKAWTGIGNLNLIFAHAHSPPLHSRSLRHLHRHLSL